MFLRALFQAQGQVDPIDDADDDRLPGNQVPEPIQQLAVQDVCLLPAGRRSRNQGAKNSTGSDLIDDIKRV